MMNLATPDPARFPILARHYGGLGPPEMRRAAPGRAALQSQATNPETIEVYQNRLRLATEGGEHVE